MTDKKKSPVPVLEENAEPLPENETVLEKEELEQLRKFNNRLQKQVLIVEEAERNWLEASGRVQAAKEEMRELKEVFDSESKTLSTMVKNGVGGMGNELPGFSPEEIEESEKKDSENPESSVVDLSQYSVKEIGISDGIYDKLTDAKIYTVEDLRQYLNSYSWERDKIPGIGSETLNKLCDLLNAFTEPLYQK